MGGMKGSRAFHWLFRGPMIHRREGRAWDPHSSRLLTLQSVACRCGNLALAHVSYTASHGRLGARDSLQHGVRKPIFLDPPLRQRQDAGHPSAPASVPGTTHSHPSSQKQSCGEQWLSWKPISWFRFRPRCGQERRPGKGSAGSRKPGPTCVALPELAPPGGQAPVVNG